MARTSSPPPPVRRHPADYLPPHVISAVEPTRLSPKLRAEWAAALLAKGSVIRAIFRTLGGAALCAALAGCAVDAQSGDGQAEAGVPPVATCPSETRGWTAWISAMPGPNATPSLIVTAEAFVPAGTAATLSAGPTDRMMPPSQRFTLALSSRPDAPGGWQEVRGTISPALAEYRSVMVGCGDAVVATITDIQTAQ